MRGKSGPQRFADLVDTLIRRVEAKDAAYTEGRRALVEKQRADDETRLRRYYDTEVVIKPRPEGWHLTWPPEDLALYWIRLELGIEVKIEHLVWLRRLRDGARDLSRLCDLLADRTDREVYWYVELVIAATRNADELTEYGQHIRDDLRNISAAQKALAALRQSVTMRVVPLPAWADLDEALQKIEDLLAEAQRNCCADLEGLRPPRKLRAHKQREVGAAANRFASMMAHVMHEKFGRPHHSIVADLVDVLFDVEMSPEAVRKAARRAPDSLAT